MRLFRLSPSGRLLRTRGNPSAKSSRKKQVRNWWSLQGFDSIGEESQTFRDVFVGEISLPDFLKYLK